MNNSLDALLRAINPGLFLEASAPIEQHFYAHISKTTLQIVAISPSDCTAEDITGLKIDSDLAKKFLSGEENPSSWAVKIESDVYSIVKKTVTNGFVSNRVDIISIVEVPWVESQYPDVKLVVDLKEDIIEIHYNGDGIKKWVSPARLYFTREGDPSFLKCAFSLDINILDRIVTSNKLKCWPNPVILPLSDVDDLSVYTIKSDLKISINHKHEAINN